MAEEDKQLKRNLELLYEIGCLRHMPRSWKRFGGANYANLADHHYRVGVIATMIQKKEGKGSLEKILQMAMIHDWQESRTGDRDYLQRQYVTAEYDTAISDMLKDTIFEGLKPIWEEYEEKKTIEAKIVKDADTLDVDLEIMEQAIMGNKTTEDFHPKRKAVRSKLYTNSSIESWDAIQNSTPHDWHGNAPNRFNAGDWKKD